MPRTLLAVAAVAALASPVRADRMAPVALPAERALRVPVVVVGKVTAVEKEAVDAPLFPGAANKVPHKIAVVKVEANLAGADGLTHLKVGFVTAGTPGIRPGRGPDNPALAEGQEWLFFLTKSPDGPFHTIPYMTPPLDAKSADFKDQVGGVKAVLAAVADPAKALAAEKPADRARAAVALVLKYRTPPEGGREIEAVTLSAEESRPILKALAAADWTADPAGGRLNGLSAFYQLGLGEADGWKAPAAKPGEDFAEATRRAFAAWLDGAGKDYRIKKLVPKKK